jgi:hypothetical protein
MAFDSISGLHVPSGGSARQITVSVIWQPLTQGQSSGAELQVTYSMSVFQQSSVKWYEVIAIRLTELKDRRHGRSGPHEFCQLRRLGGQALQPLEDMVGIVHDSNTGTLCVTARPVVL